MVGVEKAIDRFAIPVESNKEARPQPLQKRLEGLDGHLVGVTALDSTHKRLGDSSLLGEVSLTPAAMDAERSRGAPEADGVHWAMLGCGACPTIIRAIEQRRTRPGGMRLSRLGFRAHD